MSSFSKYGIFYVGSGGGTGPGGLNFQLPLTGLSSELLFNAFEPIRLYDTNLISALDFSSNMTDSGLNGYTWTTAGTISYTTTSSITNSAGQPIYISGSSLNTTKNSTTIYNTTARPLSPNGLIVSLWFYISDGTFSGAYATLFQNMTQSGDAIGRLLIGFDNTTALSSAKLQITCGRTSSAENTYAITTTGIITTNKWNHLAFSVSSTGIWLVLLNGEQVTIPGANQTTNYATISNSSSYYGACIGCSSASQTSANVSRFSGYIDRFRLYNRGATSIDELYAIYNNDIGILDTAYNNFYWTLQRSQTYPLFSTNPAIQGSSICLSLSSKCYSTRFINNSSNGHTFSLWFNINAIQSSSDIVLISDGTVTGGQRLYIYGIGSTISTATWYIIYGNKTSGENSFQIGTAGIIQFNTWNHIAFSVSQSGVWSIILNGVQYTNPNNTTNYGWTSTALCIGHGYIAGACSWTGYVDNFRYYKRAMSVSEMMLLYNEYSYLTTSTYKTYFIGTSSSSVTLTGTGSFYYVAVGPGGAGGGRTDVAHYYGGGGGGGISSGKIDQTGDTTYTITVGTTTLSGTGNSVVTSTNTSIVGGSYNIVAPYGNSVDSTGTVDVLTGATAGAYSLGLTGYSGLSETGTPSSGGNGSTVAGSGSASANAYSFTVDGTNTYYMSGGGDGCNVYADNLVADYRIRFDVSSGNVTYADNGDIVNIGNASCTSSDYKVGVKSFYSSITTGYAQIAPGVNYPMPISGGITFTCWFKTSNTTATWGRLFEFGQSNLSTAWYKILFGIIGGPSVYNATGILTQGGVGGAAAYPNQPGKTVDYNNNIWHLFTWSMSYSSTNSSNWNVYIDAIAYYSITNGYYPPTATRTLKYIGNSTVPDSSSPAPLYVDDFRIYNRVLTQAEVTTIYNNTASTYKVGTNQYGGGVGGCGTGTNLKLSPNSGNQPGGGGGGSNSTSRATGGNGGVYLIIPK